MQNAKWHVCLHEAKPKRHPIKSLFWHCSSDTWTWKNWNFTAERLHISITKTIYFFNLQSKQGALLSADKVAIKSENVAVLKWVKGINLKSNEKQSKAKGTPTSLSLDKGAFGSTFKYEKPRIWFLLYLWRMQSLSVWPKWEGGLKHA